MSAGEKHVTRNTKLFFCFLLPLFFCVAFVVRKMNVTNKITHRDSSRSKTPQQSGKTFGFQENGVTGKKPAGAPRKLRVLWFSNKIDAEKAAGLLNTKFKKLKLPRMGVSS